MARFVAVALLAVALAPPTVCQSSKDSSDLVYGKDWAFAVAEPVGWRLNWKTAEQWGANAILYRDVQGLRDGNDLIRITVAPKVDEDTEKDLQSDMNAYSEQYPGAVFLDFSVSHPTYRVLSRLFQVRGESYEYVTYLNPGPEFRHVLSIAFNKQGSPRLGTGAFNVSRGRDFTSNGALTPNKRLKLAGPAFRGSVRLCAHELVPQDVVLAPAGARPAA